MIGDRPNERWDVVWVMLAVSIQGYSAVGHVESQGKTVEKRSSFPQVLIVTQDGHLREVSEDSGC